MASNRSDAPNSPGRRVEDSHKFEEESHHSDDGGYGPPKYINRAFSWSPSHPEWEKRLGGLANQSESDDEEASDGQESVEPALARSSSTDVARRSASTQVPTSQTPNRGETEGTQRLEETPSRQVIERSNDNTPYMATNLAENVAPGGNLQTLAAINTSMHPGSGVVTATRQSTSFSQQVQQGGASDRTPLSRGTQVRTTGPNVSSPHAVSPADTQDTHNSTQLSHVFSQPAEFVQSTPPTQGSSEDFSQMNTSEPNYGAGSSDEEMADAPQNPPGSTVRAPALGKRRRDVGDISGDTPGDKRSKSSH